MKNDQPLRTLLAVHHFPPTFQSGAEWRAYRTARYLQRLGHQVQVVCVEAIDVGDGRGLTYLDEVYEGVPVRRLSFNLELAPDPFRFSYDNPWIGDHLCQYLSEQQPDLFHLISGYLMSASAIEAAETAGLPVVATLTDFWFLCPRITLLRSNGRVCPSATPTDCARCLAEESRRFRWMAKFIPALTDYLWRRAEAGRDGWGLPGRVTAIQRRRRRLAQALSAIDLAICPSEFLRQRYVRAGVDPARLIFCRQGLELDGPAPGAAAPKTPSTHLRLGYMGQLGQHKGVHVLIDAVRRLNGHALHLTLYGDLNQFPAYVTQLRERAAGDPRIHFAGRYKRPELPRVLSEIDAVVVPSVWYENSPNVILEAFAYGTPVVASDLGGMAELVESEVDGLLFKPGDAQDLARQLERLIEDPRRIAQLRKGIKPVKTVEKEVAELDAHYRRLVTGHR